MTDQVEALETKLNDFDLDVRTRALTQLLDMADRGEIDLPPEDEVANMHAHTFFSYNGYGYSPTGLVWLAKKRGFKLMGIVDFDVLDGVDEFLNACETARLRGSAGMETRAYVPEFSNREINSPGEPGVYYHMGIGFTASAVPEDEPEARAVLADMRDRAEARNRGMIDRVNAYLADVTLDYERDVLPRTPAGNATERHMCAAYVDKAAEVLDDPVAFWADKLETDADEIAAIIDDGPAIQGLVRAKLMKRGGVGYVQPGPETFPTVEEVNRVITACGALPCITWLDGTSEGEQAVDELFGLMIAKGAVALNIVPDRNWNIDDPTEKALKLQNLYDVVAKARALDLPINVGTEMNAYGKPLIDDFEAPELAPVRDDFLDGAYFIYGHTMLQRASGLGFASGWAAAHFPTRRERNAFYTKAGKRLAPGAETLLKLRELGDNPSPEDVLDQ
jgi:hypothetical protein